MLTIAFLIAALAVSSSQSTAGDLVTLRGAVVAKVSSLSDPNQSYALYLPSSYSPDRSWPIIYVFDPVARGTVPLELYKEAAEKYGYIMAASNNSRNGPATLQMAAAEAMWQDTHQRLAIAKERMYAMGFSGGARVATLFALYCGTCSIAGVIAQGASYPTVRAPAADDSFLYYAAVGDEDFNYPEIMSLRAKKEEQGAQFRVKTFSGTHQWAPPEVVEDAIQWLEAKAMQSGKEKPNPSFIQQQVAKLQAEAGRAGQSGDTLGQYYALRSLLFDFKGLIDVSRFQGQLETVKTSKAYKQARHEEDQEIAKQRLLTATALSDISQLGEQTAQETGLAEQRIISVFSDLRRQAKSNQRNRLVYLRAINQLYIEGIEAGQQAFRNNELERAADYFQLIADAVPDQSGPLLLLAETRVKTGNRKAALKALEKAVKRGVKSPDALTNDPELAPLAAEPAFQKIVQSINGSKSAQ
jgi:dienelactone hydrolase